MSNVHTESYEARMEECALALLDGVDGLSSDLCLQLYKAIIRRIDRWDEVDGDISDRDRAFVARTRLEVEIGAALLQAMDTAPELSDPKNSPPFWALEILMRKHDEFLR